MSEPLSERLRSRIDPDRALCCEAADLIAALVKALEWYANPEIYTPHPHGIAFDRPDHSYVAREALARAKGESDG